MSPVRNSGQRTYGHQTFHREMKSESTARLDRGKVYVVYGDGIGCNASTKGAYKLARLACSRQIADSRPCHI
jgi:hypothetical protein